MAKLKSKTPPAVTTPEEFAAKMKHIAEKNWDTESHHAEADDLLCSVLVELGYKTGVKHFRKMGKWYG